MGYQRRRLKKWLLKDDMVSKASAAYQRQRRSRRHVNSGGFFVEALSKASTYQRRLRPRLMSYANIGGFHFMKAISKASADYNSERSGGGGLMSKAAAYHQKLIKYV